MNIIIIEANNQLGQKLTESLEKKDFNISYVDIKEIQNKEEFKTKLENIDIIINNSYNIILQNTPEYAQEYQEMFSELISIIKLSKSQPSIFLSTTFINIYDNKRIYSEKDIDYANNYLANLSKHIENETSSLANIKINPIILRLPLLIDDSTFLHNINIAKKYFLKIKQIKGNTFFPWSTSEQVADICSFVLTNKSCTGVYNVVQPELSYCNDIAKYANTQKGFLQLPKFISKNYFQNQLALFENKKIQPKRLLESKYIFKVKTLKEELINHTNDFNAQNKK